MTQILCIVTRIKLANFELCTQKVMMEYFCIQDKYSNVNTSSKQ